MDKHAHPHQAGHLADAADVNYLLTELAGLEASCEHLTAALEYLNQCLEQYSPGDASPGKPGIDKVNAYLS